MIAWASAELAFLPLPEHPLEKQVYELLPLPLPAGYSDSFSISTYTTPGVPYIASSPKHLRHGHLYHPVRYT